MLCVFIFGLSEEGDKDQAEHVECCQCGNNNGNVEKGLVALMCCVKNPFLREESGSSGNRGKCHGSDDEGNGSDFHFAEQSAHFPDVLLVMAGVNDSTRAKEEECFEPGVGVEVEHACIGINKANGHDHVTELREGRVSEDLFDVVLLGGHQGGQ